MIRHQMTSAFFAVLPLAHWRLLKHAYVLCACRDPDRIGLPEREGVDGATGPRSARSAMAIPHTFGFSGHLDAHGAAETFTAVCCHAFLPLFSAAYRKC